ncbi:jg26956, partial [Pararge aegeria aegeria]
SVKENIVRKPESSTSYPQRCVESTNPHWASVVYYGHCGRTRTNADKKLRCYPVDNIYQIIMEYCSYLWAGAPLYQLLPFDRIQKRAVRLVDNPKLTCSLNPWGTEELFALIPPSLFSDRTSRRRN